jgi:hypothetical protein
LLLMSNRNLSLLSFKHPIGGGQLPKVGPKSSKP